MTNKTFKVRVNEEADSFAEIYSDFYEDYKRARAKGPVQSLWLHLFGVPFDGSVPDEQPDDVGRNKLELSHKHASVKRAIEDLGIHELRLGALEIKDDRLYTLLQVGILTPDDIVSPNNSNPSAFDRLALRHKPDHSDPFFWRSLLEVFCRAYLGRKTGSRWSLSEWIGFAFDLDEIRRTLDGERWNQDAVLKELQQPRYAQTYPPTAHNSGVGEDQVRKVTKLIGPMDDHALPRLRRLFPDVFDKVAEARFNRSTLRDAIGLLDFAEAVNDALDASIATESKGKK